MPEIRDLKQVEALVSATRQEIVDAMLIAGPASIGEIAEMLGRAPDSLYYHFRLLEKVQLLKRVEVRPGRRREEVVFDVLGRPLELRLTPDPTAGVLDSRILQAITKITAAFLRLAERSFRSAVESGLAVFHGKQRNISAGRVTAWLTAEEFEVVEQQLEEIKQFCQERRSNAEGKLYALTYAVTPQSPTTRDRRRPTISSGEETAEADNTSPTRDSSSSLSS